MIDRYVSREELQRLISALLVVLGFIALAALFGFIILPGLRLQAHASPESSVIAVQGDAGWLDPTDYPNRAQQVIPPLDPKTVMTPNPELLERGRVVYAQNCATCHGVDGKGDGPGAKGLNPAPRNFTQSTAWKNGPRREDIYRTLEEGVKGSSMLAYTYLSKRDRMALVHVVQGLGAFDHGASDPKALAALEKLFASAGEVIPNQVPVAHAVDQLIREFQPTADLRGMETHPQLKEAIWDAGAASRTLAGIPAWHTQDSALARGVLAGIPANGFAPAVASYPPVRWKELRLALVNQGAPR